MNKKRLLVMTEMSFAGSGYFYLMSPILEKLSNEYDIIVLGLGYNGEEHYYRYTIVSCKTVQDGIAMINNLQHLWKPELFICALDIPIQLAVKEQLKSMDLKYMAITPMENPPLTQSWAAGLMQMDYVFFISQIATDAARVAGLSKCEHLQVSIDTEMFRVPTEEEVNLIREGLGFDSESFVVLTVADNQERKNLWAAMSAVAKFKENNPDKKLKYILVTREHSNVGHKLRDLAMTLGINKELTIIERGIPREEEWKLFASADAFLLTSKAEGLGIPVLEAMASGLPVVATKTGALIELLKDGRGYLIHPSYEFIDVWGNSLRSMINIEETAGALELISKDDESIYLEDVIRRAREYIQSRTVEFSANQIKMVVEDLTNEKK